jgi:spore maturation protein CgeB
MDTNIEVFMGIRVLFLPLSFSDVRQDGVSDAFLALGCEVEVFEYMEKYVQCKNEEKVRKSLIELAKSFRPDLMHVQIQHTTVINANTIRTIKQMFPKMIVSNTTTDIRNYVPPTYKAIADVSDFNLISSTGQMDLFKRELGKDVKYWQIGYNPNLYKPTTYGSKEFKYDAVFIGHYNKKENYPGTSERVAACELLRKNFGDRFGLFGGGPWPQNLKTKGSINQRTVSDIYNESVCSISVSHYNDVDNYFSDRLLMSMASGRPVVSYRFPKYENYFVNMCDLVIVDSLSDIPDAVKMLKNNTELANYIGKSGAAKVFAEHTYYSRVKELLKIVGLA